MEDIKELLDTLAANPADTLYFRGGMLQFRHQGRAPLSEAIPKGTRKIPFPDMDKMIIRVVKRNPGMELQLMSRQSSMPPYWILYANKFKHIEIPECLFEENGAICFKTDEGKRIMIACINP